MKPQITVLDTGGQYCHLIARRVRDLGVYADVAPSDTPAHELEGRRGLIISGGPASVYEPGSPTVDQGIYNLGSAVLGICYGLQLMAQHLGGQVHRGEKGEYGMAWLDVTEPGTLLHGLPARQRIWMSHRDKVESAPPGFTVGGRTDTCPVGFMTGGGGRLIGIQFHPEVVHTDHGTEVMRNFVFGVAGCVEDWDQSTQLREIERQVREAAGDRKVFFFASGGVDSTVAYTLCLRALGPSRVHAAYVDTGLMRQGETGFVRGVFENMAASSFHVEDARERFLGALAGAVEPERKRHIIGEMFVTVQEQVLDSGHFADGGWVLGQGTIYPDTIESGGTKQADLIKTHHNRVAGIQKLIDAGRVVEPIRSLYKDEVRRIGRTLGLPAALLDRHPFPGPGLAIRCLCADEAAPAERTPDGWLVPVRSVGVQGDSRSYKPVLAVDEYPAAEAGLHDRATELTNRLRTVNRVVARVAGTPLNEMSVRAAALTGQRLDRLRAADGIVREMSAESGFEDQTWQFPVVLIPFGTEAHPDSIVLRPIHSVDGMTAQAMLIPPALLDEMVLRILAVQGIAAVFLDLSHKPPATIEWE